MIPRVPPLDDIDPEDSFVLAIEGDRHELWLTVEAALSADHPAFYWPPKPGEQHAYATLRITLTGDVTWLEGPRPPRSSDASGELDYGDLGSWWTEDDGTEHLDGEWGSVVIRDAKQSVEIVV